MSDKRMDLVMSSQALISTQPHPQISIPRSSVTVDYVYCFVSEDVRFTFLTEELREGAKLLLPVDSVFFPGRISTFNEPDL